MTIPYYVYELQMMVRRTDSRLTDLEDLRAATDRKFRIGVLGGSASEIYLREVYSDVVEPVIFESSTAAMRAVELAVDGVDATLQDLPFVTFYEPRFQQLRRLGTPIAPGYYVILARKEDQALVRALNAAILETWQDGSIPAILRRYGLWNETQRRRGLLTDERGNFRPRFAGRGGRGRRVTGGSGESRAQCFCGVSRDCCRVP